MEFSQFTQRLYSVIGGASSTSDFTKTIIEAVLTEEGREILKEQKTDTYKAYFNGKTRITRLAKKMLLYADPFCFSEFINGDTYSDAVLEALVRKFSDLLPDANSYNIGDQIGELYMTILNDAASAKRNTPKCTTRVPDPENIKPTQSENEHETVEAEAVNNESPSESAASLPATIVNQNGENNVYIDRADTVNQNITLNFPYVVKTADGRMQLTTRTVNRDYYNLFVMGAETFENDHFVIQPERALSPYWTSEELRCELGELTVEAVEKIKTFPALFMQEAENYYAKPSEEQQVFFGFVEGVRVQDNGIKIRCQYLWPIPMQQISAIGFELGMKDMTKAISEINRTHWAIKRINLIEELRDAGISLFGL